MPLKKDTNYLGLFKGRKFLDTNTIDKVIQHINDNTISSQKDFNDFVTTQYVFINRTIDGSNTNRRKIIKFMFTNFTITLVKFKYLCERFNTYYGGNSTCYYWIDILRKNNYEFTDDYKSSLIQIKYPDLHKIYPGQFDTIFNNLIYDFGGCWCNHYDHQICNRDDMVQKYQKFFNKYKDQIDQKHILPIIKAQYLTRCRGFQQISEYMTDVINIDENIYELLVIEPQDTNFSYNIMYKILKRIPVNDKMYQFLSQKNCYGILNFLIYLIKNEYQITVDILNNILKRYYYMQYYRRLDNETNAGLTLLNITIEDLASGKFMTLHNIYHSYIPDYKPYQYADPIDKILTFNLFHILQIQPNLETLKIICQSASLEMYWVLTKYYKIIPDKECMLYISNNNHMYTTNLKIMQDLICYKINPDKNTFEHLLKMRSVDAIELSINNGLELDISDIELALTNNMGIKNLERFNIKYDELLYFLCFKHNYYPDEYMNKMEIDHKVIALRNLCRRVTSVEKFVQYMEKNKIKPDGYCLAHAIKNHYHLIVDYMLTDLKCDLSIYSLYCATNLKNFHILDNFMKLTEKYQITYEELIKPYDHIDLDNLPPIVKRHRKLV